MADVSEASSPIKKGKDKELAVVQDHGFFKHLTGDTYDGFFEAKKKDKSIRMHGSGTYTTAEGDVYTGIWENDKLGANEQVTITYADGSKYEGYIKDWCYHGAGRYTYPDSSAISCDFVENCPVGKLILTDPNGHIWHGKAELGQAWLNPTNHYYDILEKERSVTKPKRKKSVVQPPPSPPPEPEKKKVQLKM